MREAPENFFFVFFMVRSIFLWGRKLWTSECGALSRIHLQDLQLKCYIPQTNSHSHFVLASLGLHQVQVLQSRSWSWGWRFHAWGCSRRKRRDCMIWAQLAHIHWKSLWFLLGLACFNFNLLKAEFGRKNNKNAISNLKVPNLLVFLVAEGMFGAQNCILQFQLHCWKNSSTLGDLEPPPY